MTDLLEGVDRASALGVRPVGCARIDPAGLRLRSHHRAFRITRCKPVDRDGQSSAPSSSSTSTSPRRRRAAAYRSCPSRRCSCRARAPPWSSDRARDPAGRQGCADADRGRVRRRQVRAREAVLASAQVNADKIAVLDAAAGLADGSTQFVPCSAASSSCSPMPSCSGTSRHSPPRPRPPARRCSTGSTSRPTRPAIVATLTTTGAHPARAAAADRHRRGRPRHAAAPA